MNIPSIKSLLDFTDKTVIVTGSGSGLGQGIALRFAEAGAQVVVHYRASANGAQAVVKQIVDNGGRALAVQGDLSKEDDAARVIQHSVAAFGRLDVLINNTGVYPLASLLDMTGAQWNEVIDANLRSAFLCTQATAKQIIAQGGSGAIVNITSIEAENPAPAHSHYNAAKAGLLMFTRAAAAELGVHGIRVNAVAPGLIWREGLEQGWPDGVNRWLKTAPLQRLGRPEDVADACLFTAPDGSPGGLDNAYWLA